MNAPGSFFVRLRTLGFAWLLRALMLAVAAVWLATNGFAQGFIGEITAADIGGMTPTGLAIDNQNNPSILYVADGPNGRILKFDASTGARLAVLGRPGSGDGEFNQPHGLAVDPATRDLYVADRGNHRVQRITNTGTFVLKWGGLSTGANPPQGTFNEPVDVDAAEDGNIYVIDRNNHRLQRFRVTPSGNGFAVQNLTMWGGFGAGPGQFSQPVACMIDGNSGIWVVDAGNHRIQKFYPNGEWILSAGAEGSAPGQFVTPTGIGGQPGGYIHVTETSSDPTNPNSADVAHQRVQQFNTWGQLMNQSWGVYGTRPGELRVPVGIVFGLMGRGYVADQGNRRVQILDMYAQPTTYPPRITSGEWAYGTEGESFRFQITGTNSPTRFEVNPLPAGLTLDSSTGLISGVPTVSGTFYASLTISNAHGAHTWGMSFVIGSRTPSGAWASRDIGAVGAAGSASESGGVVTLRASGADIWNRADAGHFRYLEWTGDGEIVARVTQLDNTHGWAKAGVMFRELPGELSRHAFMCVSATQGTAFQHRAVQGGESASAGGGWGVMVPRWVRLVRTGSTFLGYESADGSNWTLVGSATLNLADTILVGLAATSHNDGVLTTARFDNVAVRGLSGAALGAPSGLVATAISSSRIDLRWTDNSTGEAGFEIEVSPSNVEFAAIASVGAGVTSAALNVIYPNTTFYFRVRAFSSGGKSAYSNTVMARTPPREPPPTLGAPSGLVATATSTSTIALSWTDNSSSELGFEIGISRDGAHYDWGGRTLANATANTVQGLEAGTTYYFQVRAYQEGVYSVASNAATATTHAPPPGPPREVTNLSAIPFSSTQINLTWHDNASDETGYEVEQASNGVEFRRIATLPANTGAFAVTGLAPATRYFFRVRAVNGVGPSFWGAEVFTTTPAVGTVRPSSAPRGRRWIKKEGGAVGGAGVFAAPPAAAPSPPPSAPPAGSWTKTDVGAVAAAGTFSEAGGVFTITGSGDDIWAGADEFSFVHQTMTGDGVLIARVTSLQNTDPWAKAGIMLRETTAAGARNMALVVIPSGDAGLQTRATTDGDSTFAVGALNGRPMWLRLARIGSLFQASQSADGANWTTVGTVSLELPSTLQAGLAVTSHRDGTLCTATFDNVSMSGATPAPPPPPPPTPAPGTPSGLIATAASGTRVELEWTSTGGNHTAFEVQRSTDNVTFALVYTVTGSAWSYSDGSVSPGTTYHYRVRSLYEQTPSEFSNTATVTTPSATMPPTSPPPGSTPPPTASWQHVDVGSVGVAGSDDAAANTIVVRGSGADIWDATDGFRFVYQVLRGDCEVEARVSSIENTDGWAKAGVMIRESLAANARNVFACVTATNGVGAQVRAATGGATSFGPGPWGAAAPYWVRLTRRGDEVTASVSENGTSWTELQRVTIAFGGDVYVGFAVTAHNNARLNTAVFSDPYLR